MEETGVNAAESAATENTQAAETAASAETAANATASTAETAANATETGALGGEGGKQDEGGALSAEETKAEEVVDYSKMSDDEYASKLEKIDGLDAKEFAKSYGKFCRDEKLSPDLVSRYLKMEKANVDAQAKEMQAQREKDMKAFQQEGVELRKEFNPQQIQSAIKGLNSIGADEKFMKYAKSELSNNKTLVRLLMNWNETHSEDGTPGVGGRAAETEKTFEQVWTGK